MQLDENRIAIRQRSYVDIMDLALQVIRMYAWPLGLAFVAGVVPAMCLNAWLLADYADAGFEEFWFMPYMWWMLLLVVWEIPLATAPMTLFLGQVLFTDRPRPGDIARDFVRSLPQMLFYQVFLRGLTIPLVITWCLPFAAWPYLGEVILLERNPTAARHAGQMTTARRRQSLHSGYGVELFARWFASMAAGSLLFLSLWLSIWLTGGLLLNQWERTAATYTFCFPLALWLVVGYFTVVRFLGYVDLRIRREGWEVELMMRAERARLMRQSI